jgi:MerR family mercuric resistance operon transcriptional regulator
MQINFENLTIGVFAKAAGVNVETIRFYQRKGLLPEPDKPYGSIRRYGEADVTRVRFVKSAQRLGFSLDEIAELLRLEDGTHCEEASGLAEHKLKDVREKMADLARMEAVLSELVCACHARKGNVSCPLIASLQDGTKLAASARESRGDYALACFIFRILRRPLVDPDEPAVRAGRRDMVPVLAGLPYVRGNRHRVYRPGRGGSRVWSGHADVFASCR